MFWFLSGPGHAAVSPETLNFCFYIIVIVVVIVIKLLKHFFPISFVFYVHWQPFSISWCFPKLQFIWPP